MSLNYTQLNWNYYFELCGFSDKFMASRTGLSEEYIRQIRLKEKRPSSDESIKIARVLKEHLQNQKSVYENQLKRVQMTLMAFDIFEQNVRS